MRKGFQYDAGLCVNCNACNAACILENGFQAGTRSVYSWNPDAITPFPVYYISLACNHCSEPVCLSGCPAMAYTSDKDGTVIHHPERCMGCSYCTWRCPYNAPKINRSKGYVEKCHFCYHRAEEGLDPACVTACPTGAIKIVYDEKYPERNVPWFPETGINPAVKLIGVADKRDQIFAPEEDEEREAPLTSSESNIRKEWSLITFSLLVLSATVIIISTFLSGNDMLYGMAGLLLLTAVITSFMHLGVLAKAWRAPLHTLSSPLSREIVSVSVLTVLCGLCFFNPSVLLLMSTSIMALLTLIAVDMVYFSADKSLSLKLHSGQLFFSGLLAVSFFSGYTNTFIIFTMLAAVSVVARHKSLSNDVWVRGLYFYRAVSLPLALMLIYFENDTAEIAAAVVLATGIMTDRALFYEDFKPVNIKEKITEHFLEEYEKERDK